MEFTDLVSQCLLQQQNFVLMRYQPFLSVAFHMFFAGTAKPKLSYPSIGYEVKDQGRRQIFKKRGGALCKLMIMITEKPVFGTAISMSMVR